MLIERSNTLAKAPSLFRSVGLALAAICTCLWFSGTANAQMSVSLKAFEGAWAGTGTLSHQNGVTERIRCQADYVPRGPQVLQQTLRCQSDTTNFNIVSTVSEEAGKLTGDWTETNRNARGTLTGTIGGDGIRATVQGSGFAAGIGIAARGNKQSIEIRAAGTDITGLSMALTRTAR
jgi:hypothetical protein